MSMRFSWLSAVLVGGVLFLSLSSCSDSTDVGLGVGPTPGGEGPKTLDIFPTPDTTRKIPQTGWLQNPLSGGDSSWRFLVGRVDDPIPGTGVLEAEAYVDLAPPSPLPDRIANESDPDSITAQLRLPRTYLHGDTASTVQIEVRNLDEASTDTTWSSRQADDSFPAPTSATQGAVSVLPTDSLLTIDLPSSWLTPDRLTTLQDTSEEFYGFKLASPSTEDLVVGFSSNSTTLRLSHKAAPDSITADYSSFKTFTHIEQADSPVEDPPDGHMLIQDGLGIGLSLSWDFDRPPLDTLRNDPLNAAQIFVPIDTATMEEESMMEPSTFARPRPKGYRIFADRSEEEDTPIRLVPSAAPEAVRMSDDVAFSLFRESFTDAGPIFDALQVFVADRGSIPSNREATLNPGLPSTLPVLVQTDDTLATGPRPPRATLTVTPL